MENAWISAISSKGRWGGRKGKEEISSVKKEKGGEKQSFAAILLMV